MLAYLKWPFPQDMSKYKMIRNFSNVMIDNTDDAFYGEITLIEEEETRRRLISFMSV